MLQNYVIIVVSDLSIYELSHCILVQNVYTFVPVFWTIQI